MAWENGVPPQGLEEDGDGSRNTNSEAKPPEPQRRRRRRLELEDPGDTLQSPAEVGDEGLEERA